MPEAEEILQSAYRAFKARDIDAAVELMHSEVDWPNAWEGARAVGRAAVRDYWNRQFAAISSSGVRASCFRPSCSKHPRALPVFRLAGRIVASAGPSEGYETFTLASEGGWKLLAWRAWQKQRGAGRMSAHEGRPRRPPRARP